MKQQKMDGMKLISLTLFASLFIVTIAEAAGWESVHRYVKPSGTCAGREVLASIYSLGTHTASGERFEANGNTVAARDWPLGTYLTLLNPKNNRSVSVRVNDRGPFGIAYRMGAMLDLAPGAARRIGMSGTQYICVMGVSHHRKRLEAMDHDTNEKSSERHDIKDDCCTCDHCSEQQAKTKDNQ